MGLFVEPSLTCAAHAVAREKPEEKGKHVPTSCLFSHWFAYGHLLELLYFLLHLSHYGVDPSLCVPTAAGHSDGQCWCSDLLGVLFLCPLETQCKNFHAISVVLTLAFFLLKNISCTSFHRRWTSVGWWVIQQLCKSFMVVHQTLPSFFPKLT